MHSCSCFVVTLVVYFRMGVGGGGSEFDCKNVVRICGQCRRQYNFFFGNDGNAQVLIFILSDFVLSFFMLTSSFQLIYIRKFIRLFSFILYGFIYAFDTKII